MRIRGGLLSRPAPDVLNHGRRFRHGMRQVVGIYGARTDAGGGVLRKDDLPPPLLSLPARFTGVFGPKSSLLSTPKVSFLSTPGVSS